MHIASVIPGLARSSGGPTAVVVELMEALARQGVRASIVSVKGSPEGSEWIPDPQRVRTVLVRGWSSPRLRLSGARGFATRLADFCREERVDVLHNHGLWTPVNHSAARVAHRLALPLLWTTHGMLNPWAFGHKAWKKKLAWWLYQKRDLVGANVLHATSKPEADALHVLLPSRRIATIPNGVSLPEWKEPTRGTSPRKVLFLGRIYPVKGLLNLVRAWAMVRPAGWQCVIAGPDECGHKNEVETAIRAAGLQDGFRFAGTVGGEDKWQLYRRADLLVLPSFTENFGIVVAEALAAGVPAITTKGTPWKELETHQCGWWVDIGAEPLAAALREAMGLSDDERREMGLRGRRLVEERYSWPRIAADMKSVYDWMLASPRPGSIV
jgi:glycosyltransferase involved in cell wall biosynthesis